MPRFSRSRASSGQTCVQYPFTLETLARIQHQDFGTLAGQIPGGYSARSAGPDNNDIIQGWFGTKFAWGNELI